MNNSHFFRYCNEKWEIVKEKNESCKFFSIFAEYLTQVKCVEIHIKY